MKRSKKRNLVPLSENALDPFSPLRLIFAFLSSISVSYIFYVLFYHCSTLIWSFGQRLSLTECTPWVRRSITENDGIELYVLYPMVFAIVISALALSKMFDNLDGRFFSNKILLSITGVAAIFYLRNIKFNPPMLKVANGYGYAFFMLSILLAIGVLSLLWKYNKRITNIILVILLIPICFISTQNIDLIDFGYILSPALRIAKGISPHEIYFQYDYFLSMLVAIWMKLALPILKFKFIGQLSYYALFIGIYFLASRLFNRKLYALYLFISLVIVKIYGIMCDPVLFLQVSPMRLDLWLIPLVLIFLKDPSHWLVGLALTLLAVFHHSFGLIYVLSYVCYVFILFLFEIADKKLTLRDITGRFFSLYSKNVGMIVIGIFIYKLFFEGSISNSAFYYQQIGLGFLPISKESFYWYIPPILSTTFILLVKNRKQLTSRYFKTEVFLLILAIGNSLYFFGRSHEHNIINISAVLLFVLFSCFDLVDFELAKNAASKMSKYIVPTISIAIILLFAHYYSGRAIERMRHQCAAFLKGQFIGEDSPPDMNTKVVREIVGPAGQVIFLSVVDSYYYYESGYIPEGYYGLTYAWIIKKDLIDFLNGQLTKNRYLVIPNSEKYTFSEIISELHFKNSKYIENFIFLSDNPF